METGKDFRSEEKYKVKNMHKIQNQIQFDMFTIQRRKIAMPTCSRLRLKWILLLCSKYMHKQRRDKKGRKKRDYNAFSLKPIN